MKKIISFVLVSVMLLAVLCACNPQNSANTAPPVTAGPGEDPSGVLEIPTEYDFGGYEVTILVSGNFQNDDFKGDVDSEDVVEQAQYKRKAEIEQQYQVKMTHDNKIAFGSQKTGAGTAYSIFNEMYTAESYDYDFGTVGTYNAGSCAYDGLFTDINSLPYVDLTKDWWSQSANEQFEINGKMFFATGDFTLCENRVVHLIVFNKTMLAEREALESPYDLVRAGKWTWDALTAQVKTVSEDLDGNDVMNEKDRYGCMTWNDAYSAAVASVGSQIATVNEEGELELTLYNDRTISIVDKYAKMIFDTNTCFDYQYGYAQSTWDTNRWGMFSGGQVLYYLASAAIPGQMRTYDVNFGIIPYPKLDEQQENHYSLTAAYHNQYVAVPYFVEDPERTGMLLEIIAYKGKQYVTPAFYDLQLIARDSRDDESEEMLDIIYENVIFDPGLLYRITGMADSYNAVRTMRTNVFASQYEMYKVIAKNDIKMINKSFSELAG